MKLEQIFAGPEVSLKDMLTAREHRMERQRQLLALDGGQSLISFTMNIAGPNKRFSLAKRGFEEGVRLILESQDSAAILRKEEVDSPAGYEAYILLDSDPASIKERAVFIENQHPIGRLFDIDVLRKDGRKCTREELGLPPRRCLLCEKQAYFCARSRAHTLEALRLETVRLLYEYFNGQAADRIAACAVRALLYEVATTPKPGLVDRDNSGAHQDMDFFTFLDSSAALIPWFRAFVMLGMEKYENTALEIFREARYIGEQAEASMFAATKGVNTHKGLIFSLGLLCTTLGILIGRDESFETGKVTKLCAEIAQKSLLDFTHIGAARILTHGEYVYRRHGLTGARGEAATGFPNVRKFALPTLKKALLMGLSLNDAAALTLAVLIANVQDTNIITRTNVEMQVRVQKEMHKRLKTMTAENWKNCLQELDQTFIERNISPGGCADLLAITLMLHFISEL